LADKRIPALSRDAEAHSTLPIIRAPPVAGWQAPGSSAGRCWRRSYAAAIASATCDRGSAIASRHWLTVPIATYSALTLFCRIHRVTLRGDTVRVPTHESLATASAFPARWRRLADARGIAPLKRWTLGMGSACSRRATNPWQPPLRRIGITTHSRRKERHATYCRKHHRLCLGCHRVHGFFPFRLPIISFRPMFNFICCYCDLVTPSHAPVSQFRRSPAGQHGSHRSRARPQHNGRRGSRRYEPPSFTEMLHPGTSCTHC